MKQKIKTKLDEKLEEKLKEKKEKLKAKQALYRRQQYQKQKQKLKKLKEARKKPTIQFVYPKEIESALLFFSGNGFQLAEDLTLLAVQNARVLLSRVFHPDRGGSHQEMLELNKNAELLKRFLLSK